MRNIARLVARSALTAYRRRPKKPALNLGELVTRYDIPRGGVLHLGANDGNEAEMYDRCGFEKVVWVEGFDGFYRALREHLARYPRQSAHKVLISDVDGEELAFRVASNRVSSTVFTPTETFSEDFPNVPFVEISRLRAQRLDTYIAANGVDLADIRNLVVDLEGSELKALVSLGHYLDHFDFALIEVSVTQNYVSGPRLAEMDRFMLSKGFLRVETRMGSSSGDAFYVRQTASPLQRLSMRASCYYYCEVFYGLYRHKFIKRVKRLAGETVPQAAS